MQPWQQRVMDEAQQLGERIAKLRAFIGTEPHLRLPVNERALLDEQLTAMTSYLDALTRRIALFKDNPL